MNKITLAVLVVVGVLIITNLVLISNITKKFKMVEKEEKLSPLVSIVNQLQGSRVIVRWRFSASGRIGNIQDRTLTVVANDDSLTIPVAEDAALVRGLVGAEESIGFEEIKVGDRVAIVATIASDGTFEGRQVRITEE